jgi:hypothetical protein
MPGGLLLGGSACSACGEVLGLGAEGKQRLIEGLDRRSAVRVGGIALAVGLAHLVIGWFPILGSIVLALTTAWIRFQIVEPISRLLKPSRRRITVWTARLVTSSVVAGSIVAHELLTMLPLAGALAKGGLAAVEVLLVAWANARYVRWQLCREAAGTPLAPWEIAIVVLAAGLLLGSVILVTAALAAVLAAIDALASRLLL